MFNKIIAAVAFGAFMLPVAGLADTSLTAMGSTALLPLVKQAAQEYQTAHPGVNIAVSGGGSFTGITQAQSGNADLGDSDVIAPGNSGLIDHRVAVVGFGIIANPSSGVTNLKASQIRNIFAGRTTNWKDVGGKDQAIVVINRPSNSGTRAVFKQTIMGVSSIVDSGLVQDSSGAVVTTVGTTPGSISYVALGYTKDKPVTVISVNGVTANAENIRTGKYPIWSYEHIFTKTHAPAAESFINFVAADKTDLDALGYIVVSTMKVSEKGR